MRLHRLLVILLLILPLAAFAADREAAIPPTQLLRFSAGLHRVTAPGAGAITFAVYRDQEGGEPLWTETQSVDVDDKGQFSVVLGALDRIPMEIFTSGDARWIGIQRMPETEQPRILLAAVPYALKASDADTLGGLPLSAFVLADPARGRETGGAIDRQGIVGAPVAPPLPAASPLPGLARRLFPVTNAAVTTGFRLASISGATSIGFATTGGAWNVYLKESSGLTFDSSQLRLTMTSTDLTMIGGIYASNGVYGESPTEGVRGHAFGTSGSVYGGYFDGGTSAAENHGVFGIGAEYGVRGFNSSTQPGYAAIHGMGSSSEGGTGVYGQAFLGVSGYSVSAFNGTGVRGASSATGGFAQGGEFNGGDSAATNIGVAAYAGEYGVHATASGSSGNVYGVYGSGGVTAATNHGVYGTGEDFGVYGVSVVSGDDNAGVYGRSQAGNGTGVKGEGHFGVRGETATANGVGVYGLSTATSGGTTGGWFDGGSTAGVNVGVYAVGDDYGVWGETYQVGGAALRGRATNGGELIVLANAGGTAFRVTNAGNVQADGTYATPAADLAERVDSIETLTPGDVVEIDPDASARFRLSRSARSSLVAGVISTLPGVLLNDKTLGDDPNDARAPLALAGQVPVKVTAENGAIRPGDLLVASSTPGHAMRADANPAAGTVIGKALERFDNGTGTIRMLVGR